MKKFNDINRIVFGIFLSYTVPIGILIISSNKYSTKTFNSNNSTYTRAYLLTCY
jgi:hypothetical protein